MSLNKKQWITIILTLLFYAGVYSSITFVNHHFFRTHGWDLGIETNTIYDYAHFRVNDCMIMQPQFDNVLSDHFSILPMFYSPLIYLFGSWTLLIVQLCFILVGGIGIFKFISYKANDNWTGILAMIHFFSLWGIYTALAFDAHNNVMAAMLAPWFFYYFEKDKLRSAFLFFILIIIAKENMPLWTLFIAIGLLTVNYKEKKRRNFLLGMAAISATYFVLVMQVIMPALANEGRPYLHFEYHALGNNFGEVVKNGIKHPIKAFSLLFENHKFDKEYEGFKSELHFIILVSGGIVLFMRPQFLIMLIPIYVQKLFSDDGIKWGLAYHYSIEFVPIITIALFSWIVEERNKKYKYVLACAGILITAYATQYVIKDAQSIPYMKDHIQINSKEHYQREFNVNDVYETMKLIPPDANVSASNEVVSHLSVRQYIYMFPVIGNAEYLMLLDDNCNYPLSVEQNKEEIKKLMTNPEWKLIHQQGPAYLFKRAS
jgi:uncharacterized membrane protein